MSINPELLSLELERSNLLGEIAHLEKYLPYADGRVYSQDMAKIGEYEQRITVIEDALQGIKADVDVAARKEAARELYNIAITLNKLARQGHLSWDKLGIIKVELSREINKLLGVE